MRTLRQETSWTSAKTLSVARLWSENTMWRFNDLSNTARP
jgi:hypothetical protein